MYDGEISLGEIIVSLDKIEEQAKEIGNEFKDELELINQAGVNISFHFDNYGFVVMVNGYSQKIELITKDFLTKLKHFIFSTQNLDKYEVLFDSFYKYHLQQNFQKVSYRLIS